MGGPWGGADAGEQKVDPPGANGTQEFTYDALSRLKTVKDGRGTVTTYSYDAVDRVVQIDYQEADGTTSPTSTHQIKYTYDPNGDMTDRVDNTGTSHFDYDSLNRMVWA